MAVLSFRDDREIVRRSTFSPGIVYQRRAVNSRSSADGRGEIEQAFVDGQGSKLIVAGVDSCTAVVDFYPLLGLSWKQLTQFATLNFGLYNVFQNSFAFAIVIVPKITECFGGLVVLPSCLRLRAYLMPTNGN